MAVKANDVYISAAVNRVNHVADWARIAESTLAFASHKSIAIWSDPASHPSPQISQLIQTGFTKAISCLKFKSSSSLSPHPSIVAGAGDGVVAIWRINDGKQWRKTAKLTPPHSGSVSAIGVLRPSSTKSEALPKCELIVTAASDSLLKVWNIRPGQTDQDDEVELVQTIDLKGRFALDVSLTQLPSDGDVLMALATTTRKIDIFALEGGHFAHKLSLEGHEDWVKSLDFCNTAVSNDDGLPAQDVMMLASGSQDSSVRLWRIARTEEGDTDASSAVKPADEFERMVSKIEGDLSKADGDISTKAHYFDVKKQRWAITFDALLIGHDNWVTGVRWHPTVPVSGGSIVQPAALLTSSADNSLILWTPTGTEKTSKGASPFPVFNRTLITTGGARRARGPSAHHVASSIWLPSQRFGEVGGASNLGFFGALWKPDADASNFEAVMAHGWGGSAHIWTLDTAHNQWQVALPVTGHFGAAKGATWEPCGEYFLSCSIDQTTRLHAVPGSGAEGTWHEIARPQSHGYDLHSVSWLDRLNFVSAADEKVVRVFAAPRGFVGSVGPNGLRCASLGSEEDSRLGLRGSKGSRYLLALCDEAESSLPACASRHGDLISQAAGRSCASEEDSLVVMIVSDHFDSLGGNSRYSFKQLENYLKWMYAQAWSVAVKKGRLFADISILLVPSSKVGQVVGRLGRSCNAVSVETRATSVFGPSLDNAQIKYESVDSNKEVNGDPSLTGEDDGKGLETYRVVALGGTFDHLHVGHKILLSMASLLASERIVVGVTDDAMLTKKSNAHLLESLEERISSVNDFISLFRLPFSPLKQDVVQLSDVAGPAGTEADIQALIVTDETISGAEFINKMRKEKGLGELENWTIGVLGSDGQTDLKGDAKALADSKIGSTAIRKWLNEGGLRRAHALTSLSKRRRRFNESLVAEAEGQKSNVESRPVGASVPPLGLSNRAVFEDSRIEDEPSESGQLIGKSRESLAAVLKTAPTEEQLSVETLWPELEKLYGHGYELLWLSANPSNGEGRDGGRFVASCCRATNEDHALVRIHDRERNWAELDSLSGHSLSITRIRWSADSRFLLSCSRDRSWRVFEKRQTGRDQVEFVPFTGERSHARIIWDAAFSLDSSDPYLFATGSRDKTFKLWRLLDSSSSDRPYKLLQTVKMTDAVTALAFGVGGILAVGLENGTVEVFAEEVGDEWVPKIKMEGVATEQINQLEFRPPVLEDGNDAVLLSAAEDGIVRVIRLSGL